MYELTLHVRALGGKNCKEIITVNGNNMHDKIADFMSLVSNWDFRNGEYYNALVFLKDLYVCSKGLDILLDMGLEPYMRKQVWQVYKLVEEICWEIEKFRVDREENGMDSEIYLRWRCN